MEDPKISVIVAVYKAEAYLHRCVDSLLAQTFQDFEILLIDDGSPDNSGKICDDYAKQDARIRVFHKENGGVASARQCGIDHAKGEYTTHVDPDDWVELTMLEEMYAKAKEDNADIVFSDFLFENKNGNSIYHKQQPASLTTECVLFDLVCHRLGISLCSRLIRLSCYKDNYIRFPLDLKYGEDNCVLIKLLCKMQRVSYLPYAYYHYDLSINTNSLTKNKEDIVLTHEYILDYYKDDLYKKSPNIYYAHLSVMAYDFFVDNLMTASEFRVKYHNYLSVFLHSSVGLKMKFFIVLSALGYKNIAYKIYRPLKSLSDNLFGKRKYGLS